MLKKTDEPFISNQDYIFMSYAHLDAETVLPVIDQLARMGYQIWYDRLIAPKETWDDTIANKIEKCRIMICFLSNAYCSSQFALKELRYAKDQNRAILPVFLENVKLPAGLKMHFTDEQYIEYSMYSDTDSLVQKIKSCRILDSCIAAPISGEPNVLPNQNVTEPSLPEQKMKAKPSARKKQRHRIGRIFAFILVVLLSVALVTPQFSGGFHSVALYEDLTVDRTDKSISIINREVTDQVLNDILKLTDLGYLYFNNCTFQLPSDHKIVLPEKLHTLELRDCSGITDLSIVQELTDLKKITISGCDIDNRILSFSFPVGLEEIDLSRNSRITLLAPLSECTKIKKLDISGTTVSSLSEVSGGSIEWIDISRTNIRNLMDFSDWENLSFIRGNDLELMTIDNLATLESLNTIEFSNCGIISPIKEFMSLRLERLILANNALTNLNAFQHCTILKVVDVSENNINNIDVLTKSAEKLEQLDLSGNSLSALDVEPLLSKAVNITKLGLDGIQLKTGSEETGNDLDMVSHLNKLTHLSASNCGLNDINGLLKLHVLKYVDLCNNDIVSPYGLSVLIGTSRNVTLDLSHNPLLSCGDLPKSNYHALFMYCPEAQELDLPDGLEGTTLVVSANMSLDSIINNARSFNKVYVVDCPLDQRVSYEDAIGGNRVMFIDETEYSDLLEKLNVHRQLITQ